MAEAPKKLSGFVTHTQAQAASGAANTSAPKISPNDEVDKKITEQINKAIEGYNDFIMKYMKGGLMQEDEVADSVNNYIRDYMGGGGFTDRKVTDTPTDSLAITNRRFVTLNGATASRPTSPVAGQFYYNVTNDQPEWWNGGAWRTPSSVKGA
jgi:hypothetical protein